MLEMFPRYVDRYKRPFTWMNNYDTKEKIVIGDVSISFNTEESVTNIFFVLFSFPYLSTPKGKTLFLVIGIDAPR